MGVWLFFKALGAGIWKLFSAIPPKIKLAIGVALLAFFLVHAYGKHQFVAGQADVQGKWDAAVKAAAKAEQKVVAKQDAVSARVVTKYVDRVQVVHERAAAITREVIRYVPSDSCPLPAGFRVVHDAAAMQSQLPDPAAVADAAPVPAQTAAQTVADNYGTCHETEARLTALQEWVSEQAKLAH